MAKANRGVRRHNAPNNGNLVEDAASFLAHHFSGTPDSHFFQFRDRMVAVLPLEMGTALVETLNETGWQNRGVPPAGDSKGPPPA